MDVNDWWVPWVLAVGPTAVVAALHFAAYALLRNNPERQKQAGLWLICILPLVIMFSLGVIVVTTA